MILGTGKKQTVVSYTADQIKRLDREQVSDGSGSLFFDELRTQNNQTEKVGFVGIPNVREVEATIRHNLLADEKRR
ncbi:MAG: hypothetical protein K1Y36_07355 [Blastocatellia bacterium]|nr:hypothetical protein [Blastocatellia bacterium]